MAEENEIAELRARLAYATAGAVQIATASIPAWRVVSSALHLQSKCGPNLHSEDLRRLSELLERLNEQAAPRDAHGAQLTEREYWKVLQEITGGVNSPAQ
jgi:hypothetical protein